MPISRVFTIPAGAPFLPTLVNAILSGVLVPAVDVHADPLLLADSVIFLPTRRAVRLLQDVLITQLGGSALLPRIAALGDLDDEMNDAGLGSQSDRTVISPFERKLLLARLVRRWADEMARSGDNPVIAANALEAVNLAGHLGELIDSFETENVPWDNLAQLVPENHAAAWEQIVSFLKIAAQWWPLHLSQTNSIGAAAYRSHELAAMTRHLSARPPRGLVIAAGSTGSAPATASLLATIAILPRGAVVLPGLDQILDKESWAVLDNDGTDFRGFSHPQRGLNRLLQKLGVDRHAIPALGVVSQGLEARQRLVSTAMRPAGTTDIWSRERDADYRGALDNVTVLEAVNERDEALCIAVALREILEQPDKTAALITPDRMLAKGVVAELARWGVVVDDSAGLPLSDTPAGIFALLVAEAVARNMAADVLLPLFTHPMFNPAGLEDVKRATCALEIGVLRGHATFAGIEGLRAAFASARETTDADPYAHPARKALEDEDWHQAARLLDVLDVAQSVYHSCAQHGTLADIAACHARALTVLTQEAVTAGNDGEVLTDMLARLAQDASGFTTLMSEYPAVLRSLMQSETVRPPRRAHPRIAILGLLEARLLHFDMAVLGGLNEGNWPPDARNDPWLSRPMRASLGLPPPEWRLGLTAHDFEQALGGSEIMLSRAVKAGGAPTVPARWLLRLAAVAQEEAWNAAKARGQRLQTWAAALDAADMMSPLQPPLPAPPLALRPTRLSVTEVETLIRDPYHIYARKVLKLHPLDPVSTEPGFSERGSLVHDALAGFVKAGHNPSTTNALPALLALGEAELAPYAAFPSLHGIWTIQFERIARWFLPWEAERRADITRSWVEINGTSSWTTVAGRQFTLSARADRVDALKEGGYAIIDYKTGSPPSKKQVEAGFAPQLTLEAALVGLGGFSEVPQGVVEQLVYLHVSGGQPAGTEKNIAFESSMSEVITKAYAQTRVLIDLYENEETPYRSHLRPQFLKGTYPLPYDHLARVAEWGMGADDGGEETEA
jgi:ATP-dependent helicase/nuclease subunit B